MISVLQSILLFTFLFCASLLCSCSTQKYERPDFWQEEAIREQARFHDRLGEVNPTTKLRLAIKTEKTEYFQGEPINVIVSLKNISADYINITGKDIHPASGCITAALIDSSNYYLPVRSGCISLNYMIPPDYCGHTLAPGDSVVEILYTHYEGTDYQELSGQYRVYYLNYTDPGSYTLRVVYEWPFSDGQRDCIWSQSVTSNDIQINVKEIPVEETEALRMFFQGKWHYCQEASIPRKDLTDREIKNYEHYYQLLRNYPNSIFARYAQYYMALFQMNKDTEIAIDYFEQLLQDGSSIRTKEIRYGLMKCYLKMGRYEDYECIIENYHFDKSLYNRGVYNSMRFCM